MPKIVFTEQTTHNFVNHTGQVFRDWTVLEYAGMTANRARFWKCRCVCGVERVVAQAELRRGASRGCGCIATLHPTHPRASRTRIWRIWQNALARCHNSNLPKYKYYGGRGIKICERWLLFDNFRDDMGNPPDEMSLDRKDVNGHYSCGKCSQCLENGWTANCRWATKIEQANNTRANVFLEYKGRSQTLTMWCRELGLIYSAMLYRLSKMGMSVADAFETPPLLNKKKTPST